MTKYHKGDILNADFGTIENSSKIAGLRPCSVIRDQGEFLLVIPGTGLHDSSNKEKTLGVFDVIIKENEVDFLKKDTIFKIHKFRQINKKEVKNKIGFLNTKFKKEIDSKLKKYLLIETK